MSTSTNVAARPCLTLARRLALFLALNAIAPIAALAGAPPAESSGSRSAQLPLKGIDVSTPEGAHAARERLRRIARRLCSEVADDLDLSHHANFLACIDETVSAALRQLDRASVAGESAKKVTNPSSPPHAAPSSAQR